MGRREWGQKHRLEMPSAYGHKSPQWGPFHWGGSEARASWVYGDGGSRQTQGPRSGEGWDMRRLCRSLDLSF